ncbi:hypothetical protein GQ55_9G258900 [Panicum hallii var. hallii]|uniref:Uncharacterized protein n=1 Tax=Panicum hallii var. hallii TaxID=1504633 RepID=A0A2T7C714_9POAL|nr:hypothetical protein GQ55_9G258900 [Panicum hallii var. hallii]
MRRSPTCRLPSPDKREPDPVARNKSWPLVPLLPVAQVSNRRRPEIPPGPRGVPVRY